MDQNKYEILNSAKTWLWKQLLSLRV